MRLGTFTLSRLLLAATLVSPTLGCTGKNDDESSETKPQGLDTIQIPVRKPPQITMGEVGQEPLAPMRLHPVMGQRESLELTIAIQMSMRNGAQDMPSIPVPTNKTRMSAEVVSVQAGGFSVRHVVDDVEVIGTPQTPKEVITKVEQSVEPLRKYRAVTRMSDRGAVLGGEVELPRDLPAMMHQTMKQLAENMGQMSVPLPEPAVGVGARWDAVHEVETNGMKLRQTARYHITERDSDRVSMEVTMDQQLLDPSVDVPGMIGATARVSRFESSGGGAVQIDLGREVEIAKIVAGALGTQVNQAAVIGQADHGARVENRAGIDAGAFEYRVAAPHRAADGRGEAVGGGGMNARARRNVHGAAQRDGCARM